MGRKSKTLSQPTRSWSVSPLPAFAIASPSLATAATLTSSPSSCTGGYLHLECCSPHPLNVFIPSCHLCFIAQHTFRNYMVIGLSLNYLFPKDFKFHGNRPRVDLSQSHLCITAPGTKQGLHTEFTDECMG